MTFTIGGASATNALFFAQNPARSGFDLEAADSVVSGTAAELAWLIIPNPGAAGDSADGTLYLKRGCGGGEKPVRACTRLGSLKAHKI